MPSRYQENLINNNTLEDIPERGPLIEIIPPNTLFQVEEPTTTINIEN